MYARRAASFHQLIMASEIGYTSSAIDYTHPVPRYTDMGDAKFVRQIPVNAITGANTITFSLPPIDEFLDLQESYMRVGVKVFKATGAILDNDDKVCLVDNCLGSLFSSVTLRLNGTRITSSNVYQAVENYFVTRFGISKAAHDDAAGPGRVKRMAWTALSKQCRFKGPIPCDFFRSCPNFLPPLQELTLEFKLNDPAFVLTAAAGNYSFKLTDIELFTRHVPVAASKTMAIMKSQTVRPLILNFTSVEVQSFSIAAKSHVEFIRGIFPHKKPTQVFMVLIETDRLNGVMTKDPFKFEHASVEKVVLRQNGVPCMVEAIETNFTDEDALDSYGYVCEAFDVGFNGRDANLSYDQFIKGATMWAWTLSPDMDANNGVGLLQTTSNIEADIYVKADVDNPGLTALFLGKFGKSVQIRANNQTSVE
jgi:hypothetical protein